MERLALVVFDIKPLQFSREKKKRARERGGGAKKVACHFVETLKNGQNISFFLKQFQDLEKYEINSLWEMRADWANIFFSLLGNTLVSSLKRMTNPLFLAFSQYEEGGYFGAIQAYKKQMSKREYFEEIFLPWISHMPFQMNLNKVWPLTD